jgi:urease beta subunit
MNRIRVRLDIPAEDCLRYYRGSARQVLATALDGRRVQFPASALRPFVTREGIRGVYELRFDAHHRLLGVEAVG